MLELCCIKLKYKMYAFIICLLLRVLVMDRPAKLARLDKFRRSKPSCSASALSAILQDIAKNGLPPLTDRNSMREARDSVMQAETPYGRVLQHLTVIDMDDTPQRIPIADPFASLWYFIKEGDPDGFRDFLKHALLEHPPTTDNPWSIIMYTDEVTPEISICHWSILIPDITFVTWL